MPKIDHEHLETLAETIIESQLWFLSFMTKKEPVFGEKP
jgi:hypothetical protein